MPTTSKTSVDGPAFHFHYLVDYAVAIGHDLVDFR